MRSDIPWWGRPFRTLSDYTDERLISELENRGYIVTQKEKEKNKNAE